MSFTVVIPARFASTRLPGKPLLDIVGRPMLRHVWERACRSGARRVVVATEDVRIRDAALAFGAEVCMTSATHPSGTDRLQEAVSVLGLGADEIVVNVQGDEPLIPPEVIDQVALNLASQPQCAIATLCEPLVDTAQFLDPNVVKVVCDSDERALYFSRAPIPWPRDAFARSRVELPVGLPARRHIGIYAYRVAFLHRFVGWSTGLLEAFESLEQLRALEHGEAIHVAHALVAVPGGVDTPADLQRIERLLRNEQ
ncbi:MAG TPA: 3-deoxy-manno-octulosonate cytidylyltransferase [Pseudomonadales bacterium]|nr:3-deoxy-manno-octulosonate cytidylyltransferase [Pseudomonadales bacterium]HNC69305.1 3-deoxy-manno-octulosonate cytidylyltransferase [Pseudomonadales bacterium]